MAYMHDKNKWRSRRDPLSERHDPQGMPLLRTVNPATALLQHSC